MPQELLPLVAAAALLLAMQQGARLPADLSHAQLPALAELCGVAPQQVADMAWQLRQLLAGDTLAISTMRCLKVYLERMGYRCALRCRARCCCMARLACARAAAAAAATPPAAGLHCKLSAAQPRALRSL